MHHFVTLLIVGTSVLMLSTPVAAQPGGRGGSDFRQRMMERMDRNGDGKLDESEVPERAREFVTRAARESGGSGSFPISISSLTGGSSQGRDRGGDRDRGNDRRRGDDRSRGQRGGNANQEFQFPLVPAFGEDVRAFGLDPRQLNGRMVDYETAYEEKVLRQLKQTMDSYDTDKNGVLEYEEWKKVSWQSDPRVSDLNKDGHLTSAELAERYRLRFGVDTSKSSSSNGRDRGSDRGGDRDRGRDRGREESGGRGGPPMMFGRGGGGDRGGGDRGGGDRGGGDRGGGDRGGRGGFDPSRIVERLDRDGDGTIDFDAMDERTRSFTGRFLSRYGVETKGKVRVDDLVNKIKGGSGQSNTKSNEKKIVKNPEMVASNITRGADKFGGNFTFRKDRAVPTGVPEWWNDRDKNGDGQVSMAEYLTTRSNDAVSRFNELDFNRDGILEPSEVGEK